MIAKAVDGVQVMRGSGSVYPLVLLNMDWCVIILADLVEVCDAGGRCWSYWRRHIWEDSDHGRVGAGGAFVRAGRPFAIDASGKLSSLSGLHRCEVSGISGGGRELFRVVEEVDLPPGVYMTQEEVARLAGGKPYVGWAYARGFHRVWILRQVGLASPAFEVLLDDHQIQNSIRIGLWDIYQINDTGICELPTPARRRIFDMQIIPKAGWECSNFLRWERLGLIEAIVRLPHGGRIEVEGCDSQEIPSGTYLLRRPRRRV